MFGLALTVGFEVPGLPRADGLPGGRPAALELLSPDEAERRWPAGEAKVVLRQWRPEMVLEWRDGSGYRLTAAGFGRYLLAADGSWIGCAPPAGDEPWRWQRFLTGQVLPLASVLRGLEVFHASAVALGGGAVAFVAGSGVGKTSLAYNLVRRGAAFVADDVLALEVAGDVVLAHPGAGLVNLRHAEAEAQRRAGHGVGAPSLGSDDKGLRLRLDPRPEPLPLRAFCLLAREPAGAPLRIVLAPPDPRRILAATFNFAIRTPERLARQLDVAGAIATASRVVDVRFPPEVDAAELAARVEAFLEAPA
jgi:hypothetical protein